MNSRVILAALAGIGTIPLPAQQFWSSPPSIQSKQATDPKPPSDWYRPRKPGAPDPGSAGRACAIPLINLRPAFPSNQSRMPAIVPKPEIDRMPNIVAASPCTAWPPK
jgi:hypothetical protein